MKEWKREGMEGGRKSGNVSQVRGRKLRLTVYAIGVTSMEKNLNSLNFLIVEQQKKRTLPLKEDVWMHVV